MGLKKEVFNAGSPYSCWLKEELTGEVGAYLYGYENHGLVQKYKAHVDNTTIDKIMHIRKLDQLPDDLKKIAVEIIRTELDEDFHL